MSNICHRCRPTPHAVTCPLLSSAALLWHPLGAATIRIWKFVDRISKIFFNCLLALTSLTQHQTREIAPLSFPNPEQDLSNPELIIVFVNE